MIKKIFILFKLGRKLARSDILNIVSKFKTPPLAIKILFKILKWRNLDRKNQFDLFCPQSELEYQIRKNSGPCGV